MLRASLSLLAAIACLQVASAQMPAPAPAKLSPMEKVCKKAKGIFRAASNPNKSSFCCQKQCGTCGGTGCGSRPGGYANCCTGAQLKANPKVYCGESGAQAPCLVRAIVPTPKPVMAPCDPSKMKWKCCKKNSCGKGEGDCDSDSECNAGLVCAKDVGAIYGVDSGFDVCEESGTQSGSVVTNPTSKCDPRLNNWDCCMKKNSPAGCSAGEGDCDKDAECGTGLVCKEDVGSKYGADAFMDICEAPVTPSAGTLGGPCPTRGLAESYVAIASNTTTTCLTFGSQLCNQRYVKIKMTGSHVGVPCSWDANMMVCLPRLDCIHRGSQTQLVPTPKPTQDVFNDFCPLLTSELECTAFLCIWDTTNFGTGTCYSGLPGTEPAYPVGVTACPVLKDERSCSEWTPDLDCGWDEMRDECMYTTCTGLYTFECDSVTKCRYDTVTSQCVDITKECFIDMDGLIASGTLVSDAKSQCSNQIGCSFKAQQSGGFKCVPMPCSKIASADCDRLDWRCKSNGQSGKKFKCLETSK